MSTLQFYPKRVLYMGIFSLSMAALLSLAIFSFQEPIYFHKAPVSVAKETLPVQFSLNLAKSEPALSPMSLEEELFFSFEPQLHEEKAGAKRLWVGLKSSGQTKSVELPCRVDLGCKEGGVTFSTALSLFWVELNQSGSGVEVSWFVDSPSLERISEGSFLAEIGEPPILQVADLQDLSPFKSLASGKWWGEDLFRAGAQRIEIRPAEFIELTQGQWLKFGVNGWEKGFSKEKPVARFVQCTAAGMVFDGWGPEGYVRFAVASFSSPCKVRADELFSSLRIRSEKQISCVLEKQCLVLKAGDWVVKNGGRWKVLRRKEEREAFIHDKLSGELFIFEQIVQKSGQKVVQGKWVNAGRTQEQTMELAAQSSRAAKRKGRR